jgi:Uma2 family endonuclease
MATLQDSIDVANRENRLCELVDGILVEKPMGTYESLVAGALVYFLHEYTLKNPGGIVLGADGALRILSGKMRMPDVSFISWERLPNRQLPKNRVFEVAPSLAVEILSEGNTEAEMDRKLGEYFQAGVELVWYIDPPSRSAKAFTSPERFETVGAEQLLSGQSVLPGFELRLGDLFARAEGRN